MNNYIKKFKQCNRLSLKFTPSFNYFVILSLLLSLISLPAIAYEDCLVITNGKMTEIRIENHDIIDVYPLITVMNDKNTLIVHPLKTGETKFSVLKNNKDIVLFNVKVNPDSTEIDGVKDFEILTLDEPPEIYEYDLDFPPLLNKKGEYSD